MFPHFGGKAASILADDLANGEWSPGISVPLIEQLVELPPELRPDETKALIEAAGERYGADPFIAESVSQLEAALGTAEGTEEIWRLQVQRWRDAAERGDGILRFADRQHALELALNHGLTDLAEAIRVDLQSMTVEELGLKEISAEVSVPGEEIDQFVEAVVGADDWRGALRRFGAQGPPTGQVEATRQLLARQPRTFRSAG